MNLYLVRHGKSASNVDWTVLKTVKDEDVELTDLGKEQARVVGRTLHSLNLESPLFIVSSWRRTRQTFEEIHKFYPSKHNFLFTPVIKEHERNLTDPQNWNRIELIRNDQRDYDKFKDVTFVGGETLKNVLHRADKFLDILKRSHLKNVVLISHGQFLKMLLSIIDGVAPNDAKHLNNCEIVSRTI